MNTFVLVALVLLAGFVFSAVLFFLLTRMTLTIDRLHPERHNDTSHVYPCYSNMFLIKLFDFQPIISSVLLLQYGRLVDAIVKEIQVTPLKHKKVLFTSCAFGNVIPRVTKAIFACGAKRLLVTDIIENELVNVADKLGNVGSSVRYLKTDATCLNQADDSADLNIMFLLLHELPHDAKVRALKEVNRVVAPGGKFILAEFHRPTLGILRFASSWYFRIFEPYGLALWDTHDPKRLLEEMGGWACTRQTFLFGNFQVITAVKQ